MDKIKLCIVTDIFDDITGGAERQIYELTKRLENNGFELSLFVLQDDRLPEEVGKLKSPVKTMNLRSIYGLRGIVEGFKFARFLKDNKTDILMTYHFGSDIWGTIWGRVAGVKSIISNRRDEGFWRKKMHVLAYRLINKWVTKIFAVSQAVKDMVANEEGVSNKKIELIHNGVDIEKFGAAFDASLKKKELGLPETANIIGCVGNLKPVKGHIFLIEAMQQVLQGFPNTRLLLVGEDEMAGKLEQRAKALGIADKIHFLGKRKDVPEILSAMDVCVLPSLSEGLSNVLLEYMAAGKPVVATSVGGNKDVINEEWGGLLATPGSSTALATQITRLLGNPNFAYNLGIRAKNTVSENFDLKWQIRRTELLLEKMAQKASYWESKKPMKIMHLISSGGLFGAEKVMLNLASRMNRNGSEQWVVALKNSHNPHLEVIKAAEKENIPVHAVRSRGRFDFKSVSSLCRFIKKHNIDIVHTHNYKANLIGFLAAKRARIPIVATLHGYIGKGIKLKLYEAFDRWLVHFFDKVIFVDDAFNKQFKDGAVNASLINNGIDVNKAKGYKPNTADNELIIGTVGRLSGEKGHRYLLEAFSRLTGDYCGLKLLIIGDGELRKELEWLCRNLGISELVEFAGYQKELSRFYPKMDIYVSSSLVEHFPLSILEAMSYGLPVVATNVGGASDLINNKKTGLLVSSGSSDELYKALLTFIEEDSLRKTCGEEAQHFVGNNYSLEKMITSYEKVYGEALMAIGGKNE